MQTLTNLGLKNAYGKFRFINDPKILDQLDSSRLQTPGLFKLGPEKMDKLK